MGEENRVLANSRTSHESWRVRIRHGDGEILGAGVLLGRDTVLTCAHVVPADRAVLVDFVGMPGAAPVPARADRRAWIPESGGQGDPSGDVALLRLERPRQGDSAVL